MTKISIEELCPTIATIVRRSLMKQNVTMASYHILVSMKELQLKVTFKLKT